MDKMRKWCFSFPVVLLLLLWGWLWFVALGGVKGLAGICFWDGKGGRGRVGHSCLLA